MKKIKIKDRLIGKGAPCFIIAEAGVNHNGSLELAKKLIDVAKDAGADAVKFQTFKAEKLLTKNARKANYQKETTGGEESQYEMIKKLEFSENEFKELAEYAIQEDILFLSTPFDEESADFLEGLNVPLFKIGSGDLTNIPLLVHVAKKNKPMIVSTGMSTLEEVWDAVNAIKSINKSELILLHSTSNYPTKIEDCNLRVMQTMKREFDVPIGYSDHTLGITIPVAAVAMGACVLEKHFTLDRNLPGPDHRASLEPEELKEMVKAIRAVEKALGASEKKPVESEREIMKVARKSIVAGLDIPKGAIITREMLAVKRPGTGLKPKYIDEVAGKKAKIAIKKDEMIKIKDIQ